MARPGLDRNVKFKRLVALLSIPRPQVRGLLEMLWDVAHESGNPLLGDAHCVEAAAEWWGEPGAFFAALKTCGLIDPCGDNSWVIHDYWHHAPEYVKNRKRMEEFRRVRNSSTQCHTVSQTSATPCSLLPAPSTQHTKKKTPPIAPLFAEGFDSFWSAYPRKTAKLQARKAWAKLKPDAALLDLILSAVGRQRQSEQWARDNGQYVPHASTWLNQRRWEDEVSAAPTIGDRLREIQLRKEAAGE